MRNGATFLNLVRNMKHVLFSVMVMAGLVGVASAQNTFHNIGIYQVPPQVKPDDANFFNDSGAAFIVTNPPNPLTLQSQSFTTSDTLNYTNLGIIIAIPGFDFEYFPAVPPPPQFGVPFNSMAANFVNTANGINGGLIECSGNAPFGGLGFALVPSKIIVSATNIVDSGTMEMDNSGLIDLSGHNLDLRRGQFSMTTGLGQNPINILDWGSGGFNTNSGSGLGLSWDPFDQLTPTTASSAVFLSTPNFAIEQMILTNSTAYFQNINGEDNGAGTVVYRGIFLQDFSPPNVTKNVYFDSSIVGGGAFHIEWVGTTPDPVTGLLSTNHFYLSDVPADRRSTNFSIAIPPVTPQNFGNFTLTESTTPLLFGPSPPSFVNFWPVGVSNDFSYINVQPTQSAITNGLLTGGSVTNVPGRVRLSSSQTMNLANTRITGPNYLLLSAPVAFQGNSNSVISSPFADLNLGVTNGSLTISNLLNPNVPGWTGITNAPSAVFGSPMGGIQAWSASFLFTATNALGATITNDVRILLVNSALQPTGPAYQQDVRLHTGNNLVISDQLNIYRNFSSDAQVLTITTNGPGGFSQVGQLNLLSPDIFWSTSLPNLQFLTNNGFILSQNLVNFAGNMSNPNSNPNNATPYQAFVNHGSITNQGTFILANYFEDTGIIQENGFGSINVKTIPAIVNNGLLGAPSGSISIDCDSLMISNEVALAGQGLILTAPCFVSDGYLFGNEFGHITNSTLPNIVTNGNIWSVAGGVRIIGTPATGDLLGTTITNIAVNGLDSLNIWPGEDRGNSPSGFANNLALGRMIFNANGNSSQFTFATTTGNNALYVDSIEFQGTVTNFSTNGDFPAIVIQPGMKIYYAQATMNGASIAEKLNGKNGGGFLWVSNYAGVYSSTNIPYPDGNTYIFNQALAISPDIASGGPDGSTSIANINNPFPIPINELFDIVNIGPVPCDTVVNNPPGNPNPTNSTDSLPPGVLRFPSAEQPSSASGSNSVVFATAMGSYYGLFYETNGVDPLSSGSFTAKLTTKGGFTAKLQLGAGVYSFSKQLDTNGHFAGPITSKGLASLTVDLQLVNNDQLIGTVAGNGWSAQLMADLAPFTSRSPAPWAGNSTLLLPSNDENSTAAAGDAFGTVSVSKSGAVQWSGTMPDGTKVTQNSALSKDGVWPVYSSLFGGSGSFIGWMQFTNGNTNIEGSAVWTIPPGKSGLYPNGLTNQLDAVGSGVSGSVGFGPSAQTILSGGGLNP